MSGRQQQQCNNHEKTYVWVKLRGDGTSCISPSQSQSSSHSTKSGYRRQRTITSDAMDNMWRWTPGYYTCSSLTKPRQFLREESISLTPSDSFAPPSSSSSAPSNKYHFTLLDQRTAELNHEQHTLLEDIVSQYLESGDIVLANSWERHDFMHRLEQDDVDSDNDDVDSIDNALDHKPSQPPHNLIELTHLHEPSVVNALRHRYYQRMRGEHEHDIHNVYTDTGHILLAVNPFQIAHDENDDDEEAVENKSRTRNINTKRLSLYGENTMHCYKLEGEKRWIDEMTRMEHGRDDSEKNTNNLSSSSSALPPHVYAVADRTFRTMLKRMHLNSSIIAIPATSPAGKRRESTDTNSENVNQSILVSGESGAGKTVTTKLLMAYLSKLSRGDGAVSSSSVQRAESSSSISSHDRTGMSIEKRILESNPILESFGNARTVRNDNSSRFGKYIEMKFLSSSSSLPSSSSGINIPDASLVGASIETYLLEKVRLVHQSPGERNYHIFYELFSMKNAEEVDDHDIPERYVEEAVVSLEELGLMNYDMEDFCMLNNSGTYDRRDGVSDQQTFWDTQRAMTIMEFTSSDISNVLQVVASLLHASNLTFVQKAVSVDLSADDECELDVENPHLSHVANLLGMTAEKLNSAVCYHEITIGGDGGSGVGLGRGHNKGNSETHQRVLTREQAAKGVEALVKATYGALFEYLVRRINSSVASRNKNSSTLATSCRQVVKRDRLVKESSIGILDIFGFESFQTNSFEQLCINYCNETLQQQFNLFVLKKEQEEYGREGIPWCFIEYPDNQDVLDLIDSKVSGILAILHDQCRTPRATDKSFALCMYEKCSNYTRFEADSRQMAEQLFAVNHYAGFVEYDVQGFVEKNRDELPKNALDLLQSSTNDFVKTLAQILVPSSATLSSTLSPSTKVKKSGASYRPTVGVQFSSQLHDLRSKIDDTSPHYIRCLKPNTNFAPHHFDEALISNQLRCAGLIQAIQVSRLGYPQRFTHGQFVARYYILGEKSSDSKKNKKNITAKSLVQFIKENQENDHLGMGVQVGKSKVFLRHRAHGLLEKLRREKIISAAITVQKTVRKYICQRFKAKAICSLIKMQLFVRKVLAVSAVRVMRRRRNSIIIQMSWRKHGARKKFLSVVFITYWCQAHYRGIVGRKAFHGLKRDQKALCIQSRWRGQRALMRYQTQRKASILIQCALRCRMARSKLVARKAESRDLSVLIQERDRLREEVRALRNELNAIKCASQANHVLKSVVATSDTIDVENLSKVQAENELEQAKATISALMSERNVAIREREEVNTALQTEVSKRAGNTIDCTDISEVICLRAALDQLANDKEIAENKLEQANKAILSLKHASGTGDRDFIPTTDTDVTEIMFLRDALELLAKEKELAENNLERASNEILALKSEMDAVTLDRDDLMQVNRIIQSELISCEEELCRVKESLEEVKKQNTAIASSKYFSMDHCHTDIPVDHDYIMPVTKSSASQYSIAGTVPDWDDESRTAQFEDINVEINRSKKQSMYELDDLKRVNRSLREDLEAIIAEKNAMAKELKEKCVEFNELNDDVEKFAEAFSAQHSEIQKLQYENKRLKALASKTYTPESR